MLNDKEIRRLVEEHQMVTGFLDLDTQIQPSGFVISLEGVEAFKGGGAVDYDNNERVLAETESLAADDAGWFNLCQGCYKVVYNETVRMPLDIAALARTRSTLLRNGATIGTAVWDPGYHGRSTSLLTVHNPQGIRLKKDARIAQLIFFNIGKVDKGYSGVYQNERIP